MTSKTVAKRSVVELSIPVFTTLDRVLLKVVNIVVEVDVNVDLF